MLSGIVTRFFAGAVTYSANPPRICSPMIIYLGLMAVLAPACEFIFDRIYSVIDHNPLAGFKSCYALAKTGHNSGNVRSTPVRHLEIKARPSAHDPYIEMIQSAGFDFDKYLALTGVGSATSSYLRTSRPPC